MPITTDLSDIVNGTLETGSSPSKNAIPSLITGQAKNYSPSYGCPTYTGNQVASIDDSNNLMTRGQVHTDEGSHRDNFSGTTVGIAVGNASFKNGSNVVTGTGFSAQDIHKQDYIKVTSDADTFYVQVLFLTDTKITLYSAYAGSSSTNASMTCVISAPTIGTGGSITNSSGQTSIISGTTTASQTGIFRNVDYGPLAYQVKLSRSQAIVNNDFYAGLTDTSTSDATAGKWYARFKFTGTVNTQITTQTGFNRNGVPSGSEIESNVVTLPNSLTTATSNVYRIEQWADYVKFFINGQLVATHTQSIPRPTDGLMRQEIHVNTGVPASTTTVLIDYASVKNLNRVDVGYASFDEYNGAVVRTSLPPSAFPAGQTITDTATKTGIRVVKLYSIPEMEIQATSGITPLATNTSTPLKVAGATGVIHNITAVQIYNTSATVSTTVSILDGATVIWTGYAPATTAALPVIPVVATFPNPITGTAATALNIQCGTTGASVYYNVQGFSSY